MFPQCGCISFLYEYESVALQRPCFNLEWAVTITTVTIKSCWHIARNDKCKDSTNSLEAAVMLVPLPLRTQCSSPEGGVPAAKAQGQFIE